MNDNICIQFSGGNQFHHSCSSLKSISQVSGRRFVLFCFWKKICCIFSFLSLPRGVLLCLTSDACLKTQQCLDFLPG